MRLSFFLCTIKFNQLNGTYPIFAWTTSKKSLVLPLDTHNFWYKKMCIHKKKEDK